jgi:nitroreductase
VNVIDALNSRFTVRAFKPDPLESGKILTILDAATRAPSSGNSQPWELFVASGDALERLRQRFVECFRTEVPSNPDLPAPQQWPHALQKRMDEAKAARFEFLSINRDDTAARRAMFALAFQFFGAPTVIYLCLDRALTAWSIFDMGLLAQSIMLAAQQYGIDSTVAALLVSYSDLIRAELGIPENLLILIGIALGYRDPQYPLNRYRSSRRPLQEVVRMKGFP